MRPSVLLAVAALGVGAAAEYVWPSRFDQLEDYLTLQSGYIRFGLADGVSPCSFGTNVEGRQNAAEWLRTAFHDMATHDKNAGTGGLDASIMYELDRDENVGSAFNNTFGFLSNYYRSRASAADLIALGVVVATASCGGPLIPFRAGRTDATEAGPLGVPQPQEDLDTHTNAFAKAGFSTTDMITMVACGHTLGGLHGNDFPELTGNDSDANFVHFEKEESFASFDNTVVTEYLDGSTDNLLVASANDTMNSDKRIFGADGNKTMTALADAAAFQTQCQDILTRMIDTVPADVTLTPVEPIDIKPYVTKLALSSNGSLAFEGRIRVRTSTQTGRKSDDLDMHLTYDDRSGTGASSPILATRPTYKGGQSYGLLDEVFTFFEFATLLDPAVGISAFRVHLTTLSTGATEVFDNAANGFPVTDELLYQQSQSCQVYSADGSASLTVVAAVHKNLADDSLSLSVSQRPRRQGLVLSPYTTEPIPFMPTGETKGDYKLFKSQASIAVGAQNTDFDVVLGSGEDRRIVDSLSANSLTDACETL